MSQRSTGRTLLQRWWLALVTVVALGLGVTCMWKVHQFSEPEPVISVNGPQAPEEFDPKPPSRPQIRRPIPRSSPDWRWMACSPASRRSLPTT